MTNAHTALHWLDAEHLDLDKTRMAAERIVRDGQRASDVIGRIRGMMTKSTPQVVKVNINGVIDEVLALTENELRTHSVGVFTKLAPKLAPVSGDRVQLQQVIVNLVLNAIDAMASVSDRPRVLRIGSQLRAGGEVLISVHDSGPGLDPETTEKIFSPFFTTKEKGIGMGLSICRSIVETHGGRLWTEPGAPHGAIFQFTMPSEASGRV
jgi:C4-dicarboxylate-specific signal transduction histidine kinase